MQVRTDRRVRDLTRLRVPVHNTVQTSSAEPHLKKLLLHGSFALLRSFPPHEGRPRVSAWAVRVTVGMAIAISEQNDKMECGS